MTVFSKTKLLAGSVGRWPLHVNKDLSSEDVQAARDYIKEYWAKLTRFHPRDDESLLGLPYPYLVPAHEEGHEFDFNELYYWTVTLWPRAYLMMIIKNWLSGF